MRNLVETLKNRNIMVEVALEGIINLTPMSEIKDLKITEYFNDRLNSLLKNIDTKKIHKLEFELENKSVVFEVEFDLLKDNITLLNGDKIVFRKSKNNPQTKRVKDFYTPSIQKIVKELFKANKKEFENKLETIEKEFIKIIKESPYYNKELVEAIKRSNIYYSLDKKGRIKFLKEHNYTGIENISGNVLVMVDHKNKKVTTGKKENI
jgi:hypothetical protein